MSVPVRLGAAVGLLCVVAAGSAARVGGSTREAALGLGVLFAAFAAAVVVRAGLGPVWAGLAAVLAVAASVIALQVPSHHAAAGTIGRPSHDSKHVPVPNAADRTVGSGSAVEVAVAVSLLLGTGLVGIALWRIRRRSWTPEPVTVAPVREAVLVSLADVRRERNVRRAIVACYARMERALAAVGAGRRPAETPFEYLGRVLEAVAAAPARVLTELYERAVFSSEPLGEPEKRRAIEALEALRRAVLA